MKGAAPGTAQHGSARRGEEPHLLQRSRRSPVTELHSNATAAGAMSTAPGYRMSREALLTCAISAANSRPSVACTSSLRSVRSRV